MQTRVRIDDLNRKAKGDLAELRVGADLRERGYKIALPFGEDWDFDLIVCREGRLERVQVKYTRSDGCVISVRCYSLSLTNGKVRRTKRYTAATVDWIAVYDATTNRCYYVPSSEFTHGRREISLRLVPTLNNQRGRIRWARDYLTF
jgi:PD-(D/E)XK endonuclease